MTGRFEAKVAAGFEVVRGARAIGEAHGPGGSARLMMGHPFFSA